MSIHAVGFVKCERCQSNSVVVGKMGIGTHGNAKVDWKLPPGWVGGGEPGVSGLNSNDHRCGHCHSGTVHPVRKPTDVNVLANMISVLRAEVAPEDMIEALRALLAVES